VDYGVFKRAWLRLKGRREYEGEQQNAPARAESEDCGIVDWGHDRCWRVSEVWRVEDSTH